MQKREKNVVSIKQNAVDQRNIELVTVMLIILLSSSQTFTDKNTQRSVSQSHIDELQETSSVINNLLFKLEETKLIITLDISKLHAFCR